MSVTTVAALLLLLLYLPLFLLQILTLLLILLNLCLLLLLLLCVYYWKANQLSKCMLSTIRVVDVQADKSSLFHVTDSFLTLNKLSE